MNSRPILHIRPLTQVRQALLLAVRKEYNSQPYSRLISPNGTVYVKKPSQSEEKALTSAINHTVRRESMNLGPRPRLDF
jgi:exosome complex RNA-binding protein Rrp4